MYTLPVVRVQSFFMSSLKCIEHCSQGAWITVLYLNLEQAYFATPENQWAVMKV